MRKTVAKQLRERATRYNSTTEQFELSISLLRALKQVVRLLPHNKRHAFLTDLNA